jgi:lipoprotein-anchoring transpeptidase ErfK/SrfK
LKHAAPVGLGRKIASFSSIAAVLVATAVVLPQLLSAESPTSAPSDVATQEEEETRSESCRREPALIGAVAVDSVTARAAPSLDADVVDTFAMTNAQGARQVFLIEDRVSSANGRPWVLAKLPVRPNGTTGYIPEASLEFATTPYRLEVDRRAQTLTLWDLCDRMRTYPVGIGTKQTPTPVGDFYLTSLLRPPTEDSVYGSYAYGLSGYSRVVRDWTWGGLVGLHGTNDPSSVGTYVSKGCIRMRNQHIEQLVEILPLGTPITIT